MTSSEVSSEERLLPGLIDRLVSMGARPV